MELTGKCKEGFEEWYLKNQHNEGGYHDYLLRNFYSKGLSMQYGVYVDFFTESKMIIDIHPVLDYNKKTYTSICYYNYTAHLLNAEQNIEINRCNTRQEAREAAIKKANEIFNNR